MKTYIFKNWSLEVLETVPLEITKIVKCTYFKILRKEGKMTRINSKQKGKKGELELAHYLTDRGFEARRGQQYSGTPDSPDIICESLSKYHIECKRVEKLNIDNAMHQAIEDSGKDQIPVVMHRKNREDWKVTMLLDDFLDLQNDKN